MVDIVLDREYECWAQNFENYDPAGIVQLGTGDARKIKSPESFRIRVYVDYGQSKDEGVPYSRYDWYIVTAEKWMSYSNKEYYEVVIGEGPSLAALLDPVYLSHFNLHDLKWWQINPGLAGKSFRKWLKKHDAEFC